MDTVPIYVLPRRKLHQSVFVLAGIYNICWGLFSAADPQWLFRFADMPSDNHPQIFACLAMVVGLYGVVYFEIARRPEQGFVLAAVGFVGKILGPVGLAQLIFAKVWPLTTIVLSVTNDLIWLPSFGLYLWDAWPLFKADLSRSK
jgi:hypothetical protein